jgi:hypothetical protein
MNEHPNVHEPRWFRSSKGHIFSWEIYDWREFFLTFSPGNFEFQINKWRNTDETDSAEGR